MKEGARANRADVHAVLALPGNVQYLANLTTRLARPPIKCRPIKPRVTCMRNQILTKYQPIINQLTH
jgi:hypothetical protein